MHRLLSLALLAELLLCLGAGAVEPPPLPEMEGVDPLVAARVRQLHGRVLESSEEASAWGEYGMLLDASRFSSAAATVYREAARLDPDDVRWPYYLATLLDYSDPDEALAWYARAIELDPGYGPARVRYGETLEKLGRLEEATDQFARAVELDPTNALGHVGLGRVALALGEMEDALLHLEEAYRLGPESRPVVVTLSRALYRSGDRERARRLAAEARSLPPTAHHRDPLRAAVGEVAVDRGSSLRRARGLVDVGQLEAARRLVEELLGAVPDVAEAELLLAEIEQRSGNPSGALAAADRARQIDPTLAGVERARVTALFELGRVEEAVAGARRVLERRPKDAQMLVLLSLAAARRGDVDELLARLDEAYAVGTANPELQRLMARLLSDVALSFAEIGKMEEALRRQRQALELLESAATEEPILVEARARLEAYRTGRLP